MRSDRKHERLTGDSKKHDCGVYARARMKCTCEGTAIVSEQTYSQARMVLEKSATLLFV